MASEWGRWVGLRFGLTGVALLGVLILSGGCLASDALESSSPVDTGLNTQTQGAATAKPPVNQPQSPTEQAEEQYNRGVEQFQLSQGQAERGNVAGQRSLLKAAISSFESAVKLNPKLIEAQSNIGFAYLTLNDHRKAVRAFESALKLDPKHLNTLNGLATTYSLMNQTDKALLTFNQLTELSPSNPQYFFNKGAVLQKANRLEEARKAYETALKLNPDDQRTLFNLATLLDNLGQTDAARETYQHAKRVDVSSPIGLEAIRRLEMLDSSVNSTAPNTNTSAGAP
jgi:tetratricopeptide (TPR) repeat protein